MTPDEIHQLARLLVKYHNSITKTNASLYGDKMDRALCRDTFSTLYRHGDYNTLSEIQNTEGFSKL